jgi:protoheme IX farnesyltransferase
LVSHAAATQAGARNLAGVLHDYLSLLKLRVVLLLVLTALGAMLPAAHGHPSLEAVIAVLLGGTLAAGGASAINCWFDRDIDAAMRRTRQRPIPAGRIPAWHALALGVALNAGAFSILLRLTNLAAASLALAGTLIYVFVYTIWLKRSTPQNIVIGGAAGAIPPLVGWAAVTGGLSWTALSLFLVILFWTPPHFWALAQMIRKDYESAHVPMLPVVAGEGLTKVQSLIYAVLAVAVSLVPVLTHAENSVYLAGAVVLGLGLVGVCALDLANGGWTRRVFGYSMIYLAGLFTFLAIGSFSL